MRKLFLTLPVVLFACLGYAQSTSVKTLLHNNVKKGDYFFDHFAYRNALEIYLHALEKDPGNYYLRERIGECYFKLHDPVSAELWFGALAKETDIHPEAKFEYAEALSMTGNYPESKEWFEKYLKDRPNDKLAIDKLNFLNNLSSYTEDSHRFIVAPAEFNGPHSDYGAHYFHSGIVFASSRDEDMFIKHKPFDAVNKDESLLNLYFVDRKVTGEWEKVVPFHVEHLKTYYHEGPMAFYDNYKKGAFTQSNVKDGKPIYDANGQVNLKIYFAEVAKFGALKNIVPFEHNNDGYSTAHPSFTPDGSTMFFSSTAPGGYGESDIYYSTFVNGRWTEPVNVGANVNTREDESFPYIANDTTLYFSSNGHGTLGGLDIYVSYKRNGVFGNPVNLGSPINTNYDDFSLIADSTGRVGFIASNRPGGKGLDDIYFFIASYYFLAGNVRELSTHDDIPGAKISAYNGNGDLIATVQSDSEGNFTMNLPFDQDFIIKGEKDGFETPNNMTFSTRGKPFGVDSLLLPMWKQKLFTKGKVYSKETESVLPGVTVTLENVTEGRKETLVLDEKGEYVFVVKPETEYRVEATKEGYLPGGYTLNTKGLNEGDLQNDIVLEEVYLNLEILNFAYDRSDLSAESKAKLDRIIAALKKTPGATLNIGAHADSRGTVQYNKGLTERRARAAIQYITSKGIARKRIEYTAFGETLLLNQCSDGVECPEEEHAKNRRAELKVQTEPVQ
jgi:outer membrane protein OmpA-like peptidoglycan-associated protein